MKRLENYTAEELLNITEEEKATLIEIEAMCEGVTIPEPPQYLDEPAVEAPNIEVWVVEVHNLIFLNKEDAERAVIEINNMPYGEEDHDYNYGWEANYYKPSDDQKASMKKKMLYSKEDYDRVKSLIKSRKDIKDKNDRMRSDYNNALKGYNEVSAKVLDAISEAHDEAVTLERYKSTYARYIELSNGDKEVAKKFFENAYSHIDEDMLERVFAE